LPITSSLPYDKMARLDIRTDAPSLNERGFNQSAEVLRGRTASAIGTENCAPAQSTELLLLPRQSPQEQTHNRWLLPSRHSGNVLLVLSRVCRGYLLPQIKKALPAGRSFWRKVTSEISDQRFKVYRATLSMSSSFHICRLSVVILRKLFFKSSSKQISDGRKLRTIAQVHPEGPINYNTINHPDLPVTEVQ